MRYVQDHNSDIWRLTCGLNCKYQVKGTCYLDDNFCEHRNCETKKRKKDLEPWMFLNDEDFCKLGTQRMEDEENARK